MHTRRALREILIVALLAIGLTAGPAGCGDCSGGDFSLGENSFVVRTFRPLSGGRWIGNAICYGPHRDGQRPGDAAPSTAQIREDLHLMIPHWNLLRVYGSSESAETLLTVIRDDGLDMKVMLGVWIAPGDTAANDREIQAAVRLASAYREIVVAVSVGNETQVSWSDHKCPLVDLIQDVHRVRKQVAVPVTVADDFAFWNKPESRVLAAEIDFITMHAHPMWHGLQVDEALPWLAEQTAAVQAMHPGRVVVIGETGWATSVGDQGEQAELIKGRAGESEQKRFYGAVRAWAAAQQQTVFFFEAFDENWKGGPDPDDVEKHWGLFRADRSPKLAIAASGDGAGRR
jgi:exo-beta-1,3-glucanase (GH17 family)